MAFSVTSSKYYNNKPVVIRYGNTRDDIDEQELAYKSYVEHKQKQYVKAHSKKHKCANYDLIAAKILIAEACRLETSKVRGILRHILKASWKRLYNSLPELDVNKTGYAGLFNIIGLWFQDIPSVAYGRNLDHIVMIYSNMKDAAQMLCYHDKHKCRIIPHLNKRWMKSYSSQTSKPTSEEFAHTLVGSLFNSLDDDKYVQYSSFVRHRCTFEMLKGERFIGVN